LGTPALLLAESSAIFPARHAAQDYLLLVPYAQRPYLWGQEESEQLLEDVLSKCGTDLAVPVRQLKAFALGTITLAETDGANGATYTRKHVFDGQQRIVTLCLLLSALCERLEVVAQHDDRLTAEQRKDMEELADSLRNKVCQACCS
jgi:hypothetical protein